MQRLRVSKKCGCPFKVQVEYVDGLHEVSIFVYAHHEGHVPSSRNDLYNLPVHPRVLECCMPCCYTVSSIGSS